MGVESRKRRILNFAHQDKKKVFQHQQSDFSLATNQVLGGFSGSSEEKDSEGEKWLVAYSPIKNLKWGLIVEQAAEEAYLASTWMRIQS